METYTGKCKCSCRKRAKFRAIDGHMRYYACHTHKNTLEGKHKPFKDDNHFTEADYQTWMRV